jgi:hypothetical protein
MHYDGNFVVSLEFLGSVACFFAIGYLIGHLLKLDKFYDDNPKVGNETIQRINN